MPVSIRFEENNHIVVWVFEGAWKWEEYYEIRGTVNTTIASFDHPVDMIIDMTRSQLLPQNLMTHAGGAARSAPTNINMTIFVGSNAMLRAFFKMFSRLYTTIRPGKIQDIHIVPKLEDAYAILQQRKR